ncbi:putative peroxiredoxin [Sphingomonas vulcanisoli]|uniref:Peroxiredoxin n=1 Tax=Sphingomonas vulcanisoli TaxID=1658060 RepID=A0ABX0TT19_9SPHN|nr:DsrE family protein [Sphingomonas vulcanisoli]NIJ08223.1 putative peroxiredoxin [Sphingomonas vulcanisoli]
MRALTIIVATAEETRLRSALGLALSYQAIGGEVTLFLDTAAVAILRPPIIGADDAHWLANGLPILAALIDEALDAGVKAIVCQAGLASAQLTMGDLDPRIEAGGMVGLLVALNEGRLVVI